MSAERGRCGGCGGGFTTTSKGLVRSHRHIASGWDDVVIDGRVAYRRAAVCGGAGMPPIGPDEPLLHVEIRDLRRENAELRAALNVVRAELAVHKARGRGVATAWKINHDLLKMLTEAWSAQDEERSAKFDADMAALRLTHPILRLDA